MVHEPKTVAIWRFREKSADPSPIEDRILLIHLFYKWRNSNTSRLRPEEQLQNAFHPSFLITYIPFQSPCALYLKHTIMSTDILILNFTNTYWMPTCQALRRQPWIRLSPNSLEFIFYWIRIFFFFFFLRGVRFIGNLKYSSDRTQCLQTRLSCGLQSKPRFLH